MFQKGHLSLWSMGHSYFTLCSISAKVTQHRYADDRCVSRSLVHRMGSPTERQRATWENTTQAYSTHAQEELQAGACAPSCQGMNNGDQNTGANDGHNETAPKAKGGIGNQEIQDQSA